MEFIVVFGGESWEHEISIVSAITLKKELKNIAHFVFIDSENDAYLIPREMMKSTHFSSLAYKKDVKLTFTKGGFLQSGFLKKNILRGIVINLIHGKSGEDGQMAGLLDFYQIDFVGPRIEACAVSFSKEMTKIYAEACGVRVLEYCIVDSRVGNSVLGMQFRTCGKNLDSAESQNLGENLPIHCLSERSEESQKKNNRDSSVASLPQNDNFKDFAESRLDSADSAISTQEANSSIFDEKSGLCSCERGNRTKGSLTRAGNNLPDLSHPTGCEALAEAKKDAEFATFPCIVKPSHLGSSLGIAVAKNKDDLSYALDCAFEFDERAIIEPFIPHIREFNLAGCKINGEFVFSMIEEVKKDEFFGFEDKYLDFQGAQKKQAADLSQDLQEAIKANFIKIYDACFEGALIRCDFFLLNDEIYLNEINPIPGSLAHYLFDDFNGVLQNLAQNLPKKRKIPVKYQYISKIQAQKGK